MRRRAFLSVGSVALAGAMSGCLDGVFGQSENEKELIEVYEEAYELHEEGKSHLADGFSGYDAENLDRAEIRFEDANDKYAEASRKFINSVDLQASVFGENEPETFREGHQAATRGQVAAGQLANDIESLQMGSTTLDPRDSIEATRNQFERGEMDMPSVAEFEDSL